MFTFHLSRADPVSAPPPVAWQTTLCASREKLGVSSVADDLIAHFA